MNRINPELRVISGMAGKTPCPEDALWPVRSLAEMAWSFVRFTYISVASWHPAQVAAPDRWASRHEEDMKSQRYDPPFIPNEGLPTFPRIPPSWQMTKD